MIRWVRTLSPTDGYEGAAIKVKCAYEDSNKRIEHLLLVKRFIGADSCTNVNGTDNLIEVHGNFTFIENKDGRQELDQFSQYSINDAISVFKAMFGEIKEE